MSDSNTENTITGELLSKEGSGEVIELNAEYKNKLQAGYSNIVQIIDTLKRPMFDFANDLAGFKNSCSKTQGGSEFSSKVKEWLPTLSSDAIKAYLAIAKNKELQKLENVPQLPISNLTTMYELAKLSSQVFQESMEAGLITPNMSNKEAKKLKPRTLPKVVNSSKNDNKDKPIDNTVDLIGVLHHTETMEPDIFSKIVSDARKMMPEDDYFKILNTSCKRIAPIHNKKDCEKYIQKLKNQQRWNPDNQKGYTSLKYLTRFLKEDYYTNLPNGEPLVAANLKHYWQIIDGE